MIKFVILKPVSLVMRQRQHHRQSLTLHQRRYKHRCREWVLNTCTLHRHLIHFKQGLYTNPRGYISVPNMKKEDIRTVLLKWFDSSNRTLTKPQLEAVLEALTRCALPLFLKLTFDYALKYVLLYILIEFLNIFSFLQMTASNYPDNR